jgi:Ca2+-binding RTX toxin-like protein
MFNAAPGASYLAEFVTFFDTVATGTSDQRLITLAESLGRNPVYQNINPSFQVGNDFATSVLTPFGLQANAEAIAFVNKGLTDGLSKGRIALNVMNAINNNTSPSPDLIAAKQMLDNKATVAEYYSVTKLASNANLVNLQAVLSGVTASTGSVITANASVDALTAPASQLFTLTTGADTRTGGAANDNFDGSLSGTNMTLNNFDVLDGAGGIDTLSAVINAGSTFSPTLRNIENVSMQFTGAGTLSLANATGVTSVENSNSSATAVFSNISSTAIALRNVGTGSDVTYGYTAAAVAGTADTATLTLSNTTGGAVAMTGVETVNIVSADGANSIIATNIAATTLNVSGTQTTALGTLNATVATLNAGAATNTFSATMGAVAAATVTGGQGNDSINVSAVSGTVNVNTGAGNDTVTATSNLLASDTLNGGDGTDILVAAMGSVDTTATATAFTNISNFETLQISDALANTLTTARVQAGFNQVTLASGGTGTINLEAGARTVRVSAALTGGLTVNDTGIATNDTLSITNGAAATNVGNGQALTIGGFETTTITTTGSGAAAAQTLGTIGITPDAGGSATLNLAGSNSITIGAVTATSASFLTIDASGLTGTAAATIAAPVRVTITTGATNIIGSANADTITASNNNTTIDGGAGNDTITAGTGVDSIAGGLGDDTFTFAGNLTASDSINGGAGNDILSITATSTDVDYTNISAVEVLNVAGTISATLGALAATAGINRVQYGAVGTVETVTVGAGFTNDLTVVQAATGTPDNDVVNASAYTRNLTIQTANTNGLATGSTFTGGTGTADRIVYDLTANAITQANTAGITAIERMTTTGSGANALTVTLNNANVASNATLTIDGSGMNAGGVLTVDASAEQDGRVVVIGGSSADAITGSASSFGDNLSGGDGNDTFTMGANLTSTDTISGGNGTDTVTVSAATVDSAFTNITSVETVTATAALTLGALANAAGVTRVTGSATTTVGSGFTAALSVTLANAGVASVVATNSTTASSSYAGALTVTTSNTGTGITSTDTITGGSGTSDRLVFNATGGAVTEASADLAAVTNIETFAVTGSTVNNVSITLNDANIAAARSLTIDGSNLTTGVLTVVGSNETNGSLIVLGGAANDAITGSTSTLGDSLSGGAGDDTFTFTSASLTAADTISGGTGNDTLTFSDASTVTDASFTNITSVENLTNGLLNANQTITLGALANASGLTTITGNGTGADVVTVGAGFTNALRINLVTGNDNIAASATAAAINVRANAAAVDANDTLQGGTGTGDVLTLTADNGTATTTLMTGFETITVAANGTSTIAITMGANNTQIAAGRTLTVNATALTDAAASLAFTGTASETDGSLSVTGGNGADTIIGGGFTDTLIGGIGNDRLTGGLSADVLTGGAGADTFVYTSASVADSSGAAFDTITDWTSGTDKLEITLNYSTSVSSVIVDANRSSAGVAGVSAAQDTLSGARGQYVYDTTNSVLLVNVNNDNLITTSDFRIGLNAASTASATVVNGDINFVIIGGSAADTITAGNGADTISGGAGADVLNYNTGNAPAGELINGGADTDTLVVVTSTDFTAATFGTTGTNTVLTQGGIEQVVITAGQTGTFLGTQLTGQAININGSTTAASTLTITGANATGDFSGLTFAAGGGFAFVSGTAVVNINVGSVTAAITTGTTLADNITGTALNDTIIGGAGADVITLGTGTDTTVFAAASLTGIAAGAATTALADRITGATFGAIAGGGDVFNISITNGQTGLAIADANNGLVVAGAATVEVIAAATATTLGATTNVIAMTTTYADSTALLAAIGTGNARLTEASTLTANRDLVIVWSNGTDSYIGLLNDSNGDGAAVMATADLTFSLLGTLVGVASAATAVNANFAFIA